MSWQEELSAYISRINEKTHNRYVEEWTDRTGLNTEQSEHNPAYRESTAVVEAVHTNFIRFADGHPASCGHMMEKLGLVREKLWAHIHDDAGNVRDAVLARPRDDVRSIAEALLAALDQPPTDGVDFDLGDAFTLVSAAAAIGLAVTTPVPGDEVAATAFATWVGRMNTVFDQGSAAAESLPAPTFEGRGTVDILDSAEATFHPSRSDVGADSVEEHEVRAVDPPLASWRARREDLQRMVGATAAELDEIAAMFEVIASEYEDNEAAQAQGFAEISTQHEGA